MKVKNKKFWAWESKWGPRRWWRFAQVVDLKPDCGDDSEDADASKDADDSEPDVKLRLINMHTPSSDRGGRFFDSRIKQTQMFKN